VQVSRTLQTGVPHIFAAGDVCGQAEVVHVAIQQGEMAARNAARVLRGEAGLEEMDYRLKLFGVFTEPQAAAVGMNEAEATASGRPWKAASYPFNDHGKSLVMGEIEGFVKMIADTTTGEILGASVVGPEAAELIHAVTVAMHFKCTVAEFARIPFYHPTLSEIWTYPAEELM
jgi:pyruvate/2-oxoglutarate dehydrogenase complex dihydrolipoamide dehydrogenase (E3) component